jgi:hypothetical protein
VSEGFLSCRPLVVVVEGGGIQFRVSNKELWWARNEEQLWKDCRKMCVHILPCTYACVCACHLEGCAAPSHGEAYLYTLRFLYLSISPLEAMSAKKNNNNKNWNPVLLLWRRQLRFHHHLKFCYARFWFTEVCTLFFWCWVILMYVLTCEKLSLRKWLKSVWVQWVFLFSSSSFLHSPVDYFWFIRRFCSHLLEFTTFHDGHMMDYYYSKF